MVNGMDCKYPTDFSLQPKNVVVFMVADYEH